MRLFLDANVLFSAAYLDRSITRVLVELAGTRRHTILTSQYAIDEARRNLARKAEHRLSSLALITEALRLCPVPTGDRNAQLVELGIPRQDAPILAAAILGGCDLLVTGDRPFATAAKRHAGKLRIVSPREALELLLDA